MDKAAANETVEGLAVFVEDSKAAVALFTTCSAASTSFCVAAVFEATAPWASRTACSWSTFSWVAQSRPAGTSLPSTLTTTASLAAAASASDDFKAS